MNHLISQITTPSTGDKFKPVTQAEYKIQTARHELNEAQALLQIHHLANKLGVELLPQAELEAQSLQVVKANREHHRFEQNMEVFAKREEAYSNGSIVEKFRRMVGGDPVNPLTNYGPQSQQPIINVHVPDTNNNGLVDTVKAIQEQMAKQQEQILASQAQTAQILDVLTKLGTPTA